MAPIMVTTEAEVYALLPPGTAYRQGTWIMAQIQAIQQLEYSHATVMAETMYTLVGSTIVQAALSVPPTPGPEPPVPAPIPARPLPSTGYEQPAAVHGEIAQPAAPTLPLAKEEPIVAKSWWRLW